MARSVRIVAIIGPTASGKSDVGLELAQRTGGEIISVDSMQVYRWMDIGTAKPTPEMRNLVPHHLIDILNPDQSYSAGEFSRDADAVIKSLRVRRKPILLVGGTALYLRGLIHGIISVPTVSVSIKSEIEELISVEGVTACHRRLEQLDPESAKRLHPNDISRTSRALGVFMETGRSIQEYQREHAFGKCRYEVFYVGVNWPREILYQRINQRVVQMVDSGLVDETRRLMKMGFDRSLPSLNSIGYKQACLYINQEITLDEMIADIQQKSRHYAKKQMTWYRRRTDIHWIIQNTCLDDVFDKASAFLSEN